MKLLLLSDLHLSSKTPLARKDNTVEVQFRKLKYVLDYARREGCLVIQAGDFFDKPRDWYILSETLRLLAHEYKDLLPIYVVYGQHDMYFYSEATRPATSLGILQSTGVVSVLGKDPIVIDGEVALYGISYGEDPKSIVPGKFAGMVSVLVIHAPIADEALWSGDQYIYSRKFIREHSQFDLILCGDIHRMMVVKEGNRWLVNTGPMVRRTADNYNFRHNPCFFVYDTRNPDDLVVERIPCDPSDKVLSREHIETREDQEKILQEFVASIKHSELEGVSFEDNLRAFIKNNYIDREVVDVISEVMGNE